MLELPTFVSESDRQNSSSRAPSAIAPPTTVRTPSSPSSDRRPGAYAMLVRTPSSLHLRRPLRRRAPFPSHRRLSFPKVPFRRLCDGSANGPVHQAGPLSIVKGGVLGVQSRNCLLSFPKVTVNSSSSSLARSSPTTVAGSLRVRCYVSSVGSTDGYLARAR